MEPYDSSTNPLDHLESYKALMLLQGASNAFLCIVFLIILKKIAQTWYSDLQLESIPSFDQPEQLFLTYFSTN